MGRARPGNVHAHAKNAALMGFTRLAVCCAGNVEIAQVRPAKGHHGRILDRKFDDQIQSSVRSVSVQAPAAMYCAPIEAVLVEGATVWNSKVFRYFGKDTFTPEFAAFHIEFKCIEFDDRESARGAIRSRFDSKQNHCEAGSSYRVRLARRHAQMNKDFR